mmetsp:Transcript_71537/g.232485  ORF Transcript_71537/g.232485 Transcript_71537/m.232485 type:complete len:258 (-) Transcript_71537:3218-3991(-)
MLPSRPSRVQVLGLPLLLISFPASDFLHGLGPVAAFAGSIEVHLRLQPFKAVQLIAALGVGVVIAVVARRPLALDGTADLLRPHHGHMRARVNGRLGHAHDVADLMPRPHNQNGRAGDGLGIVPGRPLYPGLDLSVDSNSDLAGLLQQDLLAFLPDGCDTHHAFGVSHQDDVNAPLPHRCARRSVSALLSPFLEHLRPPTSFPTCLSSCLILEPALELRPPAPGPLLGERARALVRLQPRPRPGDLRTRSLVQRQDG